MSKPTVVVLGGYGVFGGLITASLARHAEIHVLAAGRNIHAATSLCRSLGASSAEPVVLDCGSADFPERLAGLRPVVVVDAVGPFQGRDYSVARTCIEIGAHCVDLADGREYVTEIVRLDAEARERKVLIASGASTCPALSTAVMDLLAPEFEQITAASLGIAPGQKAPRGLGATRAVLSYCGKPIPALRDGTRSEAAGWSGLIRHTYSKPIGNRWLSSIDVPEMTLWPLRYPTLRTLETRAGLESSTLHLGLTALSRLVRAGIVRSLVPYAQPMLQIAKLFEPFGQPVGAMHVSAFGHTRSGTVLRTWSIIAEHGSGPQIPSAPAALIAKKLVGIPGYARLDVRGAMPCIGMLSLEEVMQELSRFPIRTEAQSLSFT